MRMISERAVTNRFFAWEKSTGSIVCMCVCAMAVGLAGTNACIIARIQERTPWPPSVFSPNQMTSYDDSLKWSTPCSWPLKQPPRRPHGFYCSGGWCYAIKILLTQNTTLNECVQNKAKHSNFREKIKIKTFSQTAGQPSIDNKSN